MNTNLQRAGWYLADRLLLLAVLVTTVVVIVRAMDVSGMQYMTTSNPITASLPIYMWKSLVWVGAALMTVAWVAWWKAHRAVLKKLRKD